MEESPSLAAAKNEYTFGDNSRASARLRRLAEMYEPESRALLQLGGISAPRLAVDLGCGPGWQLMPKDPIVDEVRRVRSDQAARYGFDVKAILAASKRRQRRSSHKVVSLVPKKKLSA
jgi:hypothetical protein